MSKSKDNPNVEKFKKPATAPIEPQTPEVQAPQGSTETDEQRQARVDRANKAIREILKAENCILTVPTLDISSGRVFPTIQLRAQPLPT